MSLTSILERCRGWNTGLRVCLVDFEKAFDTVEHKTLWKVLESQGVHPAYVDMLRLRYHKQTATVTAGCRSRTFNLRRGVKQGDPISALLFIAVMEAIFGKLKGRWKDLNAARKLHYYGLVIDDPCEPLTNLRFADDVLMFSRSRGDMVKMISELSREAKKYGLKIHMGKTKVMTNATIRKPLCCEGAIFDVLEPNASERYLGRQLSMQEYHRTELVNRIKCGWKAFFKFKDALCNRSLPLRNRMKLFGAVVTPSVLYASGTWTMTIENERALRTAQRRMMRWIVQVGRLHDEEWVDYITRSTRRSIQLASACGVEDWIEIQRCRKFDLAGRTANLHDGRWNTRLLSWRPWFREHPRRNVGRPCKRWQDDLVCLAGGSWMTDGVDANLWAALKTGYIKKIA